MSAGIYKHEADVMPQRPTGDLEQLGEAAGQTMGEVAGEALRPRGSE